MAESANCGQSGTTPLSRTLLKTDARAMHISLRNGCRSVRDSGHAQRSVSAYTPSGPAALDVHRRGRCSGGDIFVLPGSKASTCSANSGQSLQLGRHGSCRIASLCTGYNMAYTSSHVIVASSIEHVEGSITGKQSSYLSSPPLGSSPCVLANKRAKNL